MVRVKFYRGKLLLNHQDLSYKATLITIFPNLKVHGKTLLLTIKAKKNAKVLCTLYPHVKRNSYARPMLRPQYCAIKWHAPFLLRNHWIHHNWKVSIYYLRSERLLELISLSESSIVVNTTHQWKTVEKQKQKVLNPFNSQKYIKQFFPTYPSIMDVKKWIYYPSARLTC